MTAVEELRIVCVTKCYNCPFVAIRNTCDCLHPEGPGGIEPYLNGKEKGRHEKCPLADYPVLVTVDDQQTP